MMIESMTLLGVVSVFKIINLFNNNLLSLFTLNCKIKKNSRFWLELQMKILIFFNVNPNNNM